MPTQTLIERPGRRLTTVLALLLAGTTLGLAAAPAAADVRVSDNWPLRAGGSPFHGRDAIGLAVNPGDSRHIVAVFGDWASLWCETAVSFDGGRSWRRDRLTAPPAFGRPPCSVGEHLANEIGQTIVFGSGRTVYTAWAANRLDAAGVEEGQSVLVSRSRNGGRTFETGVVALSGGADLDRGPDFGFPKLTVERGARGRADRLHLVAVSSGTETGDDIVHTSSAGGRTWAPGQAIDGPGSSIEPSQPAIGRGGALYVAWRTRRSAGRPGAFGPEGTVVVGRSADRGATWTRTGVAGIRGYVFEGPAQTPFTANQAFTNSTFPRLAADQRSGAVYLVYNNGGRPTAPGEFRAADHFIHPDSDVWFQRSGNGRDWSGATQLNDVAPLTSGVSQTRHPNVAVAPGGRVDVVWQDRRHWHRGCVHTHNPCLEARLGDTYYTWSEDRGRSFAPDRRITDRSMNNDVGYDYRFGTYWTYAPALAHLDRDRLLVGWMDSRLGDVDDDNQDIYLARIDHGAASRVPEHTISAAGASRLAVTLSRRAYPGGPEAVLGGTFATRPWTRVVVVHERDAAAVLAAGVLARANIAPVLLSGRTGMDAATRAELVRMAPIGAFVVGSRAALSDHVVEQLAASGIAPDQIVRIEGTSRADTVRRIALASDRRSVAQRQAGEQAFDAAVLVNPADEDGYATAILAAARRLPVLLAGRGAVPAATRQAITELAVAKVLVAGDRESISDAAVAGLPGVQRLGGSSAVRTSRVVLAEARRRAVPYNTVFATTGRMEAALLGATGARIGGQLLFADRDDALDAVRGLRLGGTVDRILHVRSGRGE